MKALWPARAPRNTVTCRVALVRLPSASVATTVTSWTPTLEKAWLAVGPSAPAPSSKLQLIDLIGDQTSKGATENCAGLWIVAAGPTESATRSGESPSRPAAWTIRSDPSSATQAARPFPCGSRLTLGSVELRPSRETLPADTQPPAAVFREPATTAGVPLEKDQTAATSPAALTAT